jgi:hypothetical protein
MASHGRGGASRLRFFDTYLKGTGAAPPRLESPLYPEIRVDD